MVKVAAAQIKVTRNVKKNFSEMIKYIKKAHKEKIKILCFPETCLIVDETSKFPDLSGYFDQLKKESKEKDMMLIFTTYLKEKNKKYNRAFVIDQGKTIYQYDKMHLWGRENKYVTPGKSNKAFNTRFGKLGLIVCFDYAYPKFIRKLAKQGAWIIFCPSFLIDYQKGIDVVKSIPQVRAFENSAYFVHCDSYSSRTLSMSFICAPRKTRKIIKDRQGMISSNLNPKNIEKERKFFNFI